MGTCQPPWPALYQGLTPLLNSKPHEQTQLRRPRMIRRNQDLTQIGLLRAQPTDGPHPGGDLDDQRDLDDRPPCNLGLLSNLDLKEIGRLLGELQLDPLRVLAANEDR